MRRPGRLLRALGLALLGLIAAAGLVLSAAGWLASTGPGSRLVAGWLAGALDDMVAGRLTIGSITITRSGDVELRDLELVDLAGHPVIKMARARAHVELGAWSRRAVTLDLELERPEVWLEPDGGGRLTIGAAVAPIAAGEGPGRPSGAGDPWRGWTIQLGRLRLHDGAVTWRGARDRTWLEATGLELDGAGTLGTPGIAAGLSLTGQVMVPLQGPLALQVEARIEETRLTVSHLALGAAGSRLEAFGEWDWERETFRVAASRLALANRDLAAVAGRPVAGGDLDGRLYAESDGARLSATVELAAAQGVHGGARVALTAGLGRGSRRTIGFDAEIDQLDPSRVLARLPSGRVSLSGRGALAWPIPPPGPFSRGHLTLDRLDVALPGLALKGEGNWRDAGAMSGGFQLAVSDLAAAGPAVEALLGLSLPAMSGQAEASLTLAGTAAAPEVTLEVRTARSAVAETQVTDGQALLKLSGATVELEGTAGLGLLDGATVMVRSAATLSPDWRRGAVTRLEIGLAGRDWRLMAPATVTFDGPRVDRLELRSGVERLALTGGLDAGGSADALLEVDQLELARMPRWLVPGSLGLAGRGGGSLQVSGSAARRTLVTRVRISEGALLSLDGLALEAELAWRRESGRIVLDAALRRAAGGTLEVAADLPWPLAGAAASQSATGRIAAGGWPLQPLFRALRVEFPADGRLTGELTLTGPAGEPRLAGRATVTEGRWADVTPLLLTASLDGAGPELRVTAELALADRALARATAELPYQRGALLAHPGRVLGQLAGAAWSAHLELPGTELATLAGKAGLPQGLSGRLSGDATVSGTPAAPRGTGRLALAGGTLAGYPTLGGRASFTLEPARTGVEVELESEGAPALRLAADVAAPVEELGRAEVQRRAPLRLTAVIDQLTLPGSPKARWSLSGRVGAKLELAGTLVAPQGTAALETSELKVGGMPFGDLKGTARSADGATRFELTLAPAKGGTLRLDGTLGAAPGIWTTAPELAGAHLRMAVHGNGLSMGFLPPLLPGKLRAATGTIETELTVTGSARAPRVAGTLSLADGVVTLAGLGSFTGVGFEASFDPGAVRVKGLSINHASGRLEGTLSLEGLDGDEPRLGGVLTATDFTLARNGMDLATFDARAELGGRVRDGRLEAELNLGEGATIRLPRKAPRNLQPLDDRPDIVIGEEPPETARGRERAGGPGEAPGVTGQGTPSLAVSIRVRCRELLVKSDQPRLHVELRTDSTYDVTASPLKVSGTLDTVEGNFEPIAGRLFKVIRGHVGFTGGPLGEAQLDLAADHEAPSVKVHATVSGTIRSPNLRLTSEPPLGEAALAMLIVTGRTDMAMGGTPGTPFKAQDAGMAAAMAVANRAFEEKLGEKMPLDSLTLDSSAVTAGKQLSDRIFVNYLRRFDARPEQGENVDEVRVQYHITPRWTLESRYGNAGAGGASVMWQKDY
jgi:translocation and assembly module TamB